MDYLVESILEYFKEVNEKHWPEHIIKYDLTRLLNEQLDDLVEAKENEWLSLASECDSIDDFLSKFRL